VFAIKYRESCLKEPILCGDDPVFHIRTVAVSHG